MSLNRVTLIGNLGGEPELRATNEGAVCTFSLATNESYGTSEERRQHTEWHNIVTFGKLAQNCSRYLKKGSRVFIEGRFRTSTYEDKQAKKHHKCCIYPSIVHFLGSSNIGDHELLLEASATDEQSTE
jgi:single-strand DNA-binding protein